MKRYHVLAFLLFVTASAFAGTKKDSILALTGNLRTKLVWVRWPWCDENYNPVQAYKVEGENSNAHPFTQLMAFDTEEGNIKFLDSAIGSHVSPRITRRDGSHAIWNDDVNKCSWIRPISGATPRRKLIDGGDYFVAACQFNPVTNEEFLYLVSPDNKTLYRVPLKADYTVDPAQKVQLRRSSDNIGGISSSEDGLYLGVQNPWPSCQIFNVTSGQLLMRRAPGAFGCQPNMAPDNSYRFFHLRDDHRLIRMWGSNLDTTNWDVRVNEGMPGNVTNHDCAIPRWTNNPRFFTNAYPLITGIVPHFGAPRVFNMSAAQIRAADPAEAGTFCLGRFSPDFKSVEGYVLISGFDTRRREVNGDAWIAGSTDKTPPSAPGNLQAVAQNESKIRLTWSAATDAESGILEYSVFRGQTCIARIAGTITTYTDSLLRENTDYTYRVSATNGAGLEGPKSTAATVRTPADTRPPTIVTVAALGKNNEVTIIFSEAVSSATAGNTANYSLAPSIPVSGAALSGGGMMVTLTLGGALSAGTNYTLTINNVRDTAASPNTIAANSTAQFTFFPCGDDFNASTLDAGRWSVVDAFGGKGLVKQENGSLYIRADASSNITSNAFMGVRRSDITGDFDVWVKVVNANIAPTVTQSGIMAANNITQLNQGGYVTIGIEYYNDKTSTALPSGAVFVFRYGKNSAGFLDGAIESHTNVALPCWLRLVKKDKTFTAYSSIAGPWGWTQIGSAEPVSTAANSQIGLYSAMAGSAQPWGSHAMFDEFGCTIAGLGSLPTGASVIARAAKPQSPVLIRGNTIEALLPSGAHGSISILNAAGRPIAHVRGTERIVYSLDNRPAGVYIAKVHGVGTAPVYRTFVKR